MISIRGAISVENNTKEDILDGTTVLLSEMIKENKLDLDLVTTVFFTATKDLTKAYPAVAARGLGFIDCALSCLQEMDVEGSLEKCIRILIQVEGSSCQKDSKHVYLRKAKILRPDLAK